MSMLVGRLFRYAARRIAFDPRARETLGKVAREAMHEARLIAEDNDRARAAGRSVRRTLRKLQGDDDEPER